MFKRRNYIQVQDGFIMPLAIVFLVLISTVGITMMFLTTQAYTNTIRFSYAQIAHAASKGAIDYAEEEYEKNPSYNGTDEQDLLVNDRYRVTIEVEVLYDQGSSAKRIRAYGRVYLPEIADNASYVREIQASIIRNGEIAGSPADYEPLIWLDASAANTLYQPSSSAAVETVDALYGGSYDDVVEQRGSDANNNPGRLDFGGNDIEMSWDGNNKGHQSIGLRFRNVNVDQSEQINSAYIQFTTRQTKQAGDVRLRVHGVDTNNAPTWSGYYAVDNATKTSSSTLWEPANWNNVGASGIDERVDVTAIVQEIVDRGGWSDGNAMAFTITWDAGAGIRTATKGRDGEPTPQLIINYGSGGGGGGAASSNGDQVGRWLDTTLNGYDGELEFGDAPTLVTNAINGRNAVRFSANGVLRSEVSPTVSGQDITAFMVMRPRTTSDTNARFLSGMNTSQSSDENTQNGVSLLARNGSGTTIQSRYNNTTAESVSSAIDATWSVYSSRISDDYVERLLRNGIENYSSSVGGVNYSLNEFFYGGRRSGSVGADFADVDIAEVIIYDDLLSCSQMQEVENYFGAKYGISITQRSSCP